jgi:hypothetical protein
MLAAAHLQHHQAAMHEFPLLDVTQQNDRIGQRRNMLLARALSADQGFVGRGTETRDLPLLDERGEADEELAESDLGRDAFQCRKTVDGDAIRLEFLDQGLNGQKMVRQALRLGIKADDLQFAVRFHLLEVHAPALRVAEKLAATFLIPDQEGASALRHAAGKEMRHQQSLAGARGAADQRDTVAEKTAGAHFVEFVIPAGDPLGAGLLLQAQGG